MHYLLISFWSMFSFFTAGESFKDYPVYQGNDLGLTYTPQASEFKLWSPPAEKARLRLYAKGLGGKALKTLNLKKQDGVWYGRIKGDQVGKYYAFQVQINGQWLAEVPDPYAKAVGANGKRGQILDLKKTNPVAWESDQRPPLKSATDIIIYELHIRDLSTHPTSGISNKGKFLGLTEEKTKSPEGLTTGLDHLKELGITHVHLLPVYDYSSIDETKLEENKFNWGYDPQNYNALEGSYSTNPEDGAVRIREFKQVVQALHSKGIRVIMDVVYNHTGVTEGSNFNQLVPGYYYRQNDKGGFSDASACGNETASERPMMRKFMVESVLHWAKEYHIDGFRFDLMGIHDIETMNAISKAVREVDPSIFLYGEGWTAGGSPLPDDQRGLKANVSKMDHVAVFSDDIRDAIRGHVFTHTDKGFVSGAPGLKESVKFGVVASTYHPEVKYPEVKYYSKTPYAKEPWQVISYASCHDNHTLWDRLAVNNPLLLDEERLKMYRLSLLMVLTAQGVTFLHAGTEMAVTKGGAENSYNLADAVNQLNWTRKHQYKDLFNFTRDLIYLRKSHPAFRMTSSAQIREHLEFLPHEDENVTGFLLKNHANNDPWQTIAVVYNGSGKVQTMPIPRSEWKIVCDGEKMQLTNPVSYRNSGILVPPYSGIVMYTDGLGKVNWVEDK
jgi:pullulanase